MCNPGFAYAISLGLGGLILLISAYRNQFVASGLNLSDNPGMFYGKICASTYTGSAVGSGPIFFSVWPYIIANMQTNRDRTEFFVEINPVLLAAIIGKVTPDEIRQEVERMTQPDPHSRTEAEEGRRLIRLSQFSYRVVNGSKYHNMRSEHDRREQNREAQSRFRQKAREHRKGKGKAIDTGMDGKPASAAYKAGETSEVKKWENGEKSCLD